MPKSGLRKCRFKPIRAGDWIEGFFHRFYETGGDENQLCIVIEEAGTGRVHSWIFSVFAEFEFLEPPDKGMGGENSRF